MQPSIILIIIRVLQLLRTPSMGLAYPYSSIPDVGQVEHTIITALGNSHKRGLDKLPFIHWCATTYSEQDPVPPKLEGPNKSDGLLRPCRQSTCEYMYRTRSISSSDMYSIKRNCLCHVIIESGWVHLQVAGSCQTGDERGWAQTFQPLKVSMRVMCFTV